MISFYLKKIKNSSVETLGSIFLNPSGVIQDLFLLVLSFEISLMLRLGNDFSQISIYAIVFNTLLYALFGVSIFLTKHIYKNLWLPSLVGEQPSSALSVTYITLLYIPITFILPPDLSLPQSTSLISWFVAITFLQISSLGKIEKTKASLPKRKKEKTFNFKDLLERKVLTFDHKEMHSLIIGKRVLITGAGGTIGRELARQISDCSPSHLCLVDHSEYLLSLVKFEMNERHPQLFRDTVLGDIACRKRMRHIISAFKPEFVFHAAALKQNSFVEANLSQAVLINIIGTQNVAEACRDFNVRTMLLVSTNEAMNPVNVMGATKRLAECYCQALDILERKKPSGTRYGIVRFGNILGSSGSIVPLFQKQIEKGGPITITHPDIQRYFITIPEAVEFILQSMALIVKENGQPGRVFALDRGEPLKIIDLARKMIISEGLQPDVDIKFEFTGLRKGEKLIEDEVTENLLVSEIPSILITVPRTMDHGFLGRAFLELAEVSKNQDTESMLRLLHALIPEFKKHEIEIP